MNHTLTDKQREYLRCWRNYFYENKDIHVIMPFHKGNETTKGKFLHIYLSNILLRDYYKPSDKMWLNGLKEIKNIKELICLKKY